MKNIETQYSYQGGVPNSKAILKILRSGDTLNEEVEERDIIQDQIKQVLNKDDKTYDASPAGGVPYYHDHLLQDVMNQKYLN